MMMLASRALAVNLELEHGIHPSNIYALVDAWLEQGRACRRRCRFLIIEGPSYVGKTQVVLNLFGPASCVDTNCSSTPEPDLRAFDSTKHRDILYVEAPCSLVLRNKKLLQAGATSVQLGCNMKMPHVRRLYSPNVHGDNVEDTVRRIRHVTISKADQYWLAANGAPLHVTEKTYL